MVLLSANLPTNAYSSFFYQNGSIKEKEKT